MLRPGLRFAWVVLASACSSPIALLPPLDDFRTLLIGARSERVLSVASLPGDELLFTLPSAVVDGAHGDILLYRDTLEELDLEPVGGKITLSDELDADALPTPDGVFALSPQLEWLPADAEPWARRRTEKPACLDMTSVSVELGVAGNVLSAHRWSDDELLVLFEAGEALRLFVVSETAAREVRPALSAGREYKLTVDDVGHAWLVNATREIVPTATITFLELDRRFEVVSERSFSTDIDGRRGTSIHSVVVGREGGRRELFVLGGPRDLQGTPFALRWRDDEDRVSRLPWPAPGAQISECESVGVLRHHFEWRGPDRASFLLRQDTLNHWDAGVLTTEPISAPACGGVLLDGSNDTTLALMLLDTPLASSDLKLYARDAGAWSRLDFDTSVVNGRDLITWKGHLLATGDLGTVVELQRTKAGGVRACAPLTIAPNGPRIAQLTPVGDALAATGAGAGAASAEVHWLRD